MYRQLAGEKAEEFKPSFIHVRACVPVCMYRCIDVYIHTHINIMEFKAGLGSMRPCLNKIK